MEVVDLAPTPIRSRKRKADAQDSHNERLSKRLSLLNLEKNGAKMYVPVENPAVRLATPTVPPAASDDSRLPPRDSHVPRHAGGARPVDQDSVMQLDDSKYKVYIYNLDDELSSESEPEEAKLVFLPDIEKHLRESRVRIPPPIPHRAEPDMAGKELVLYSVPSSLSIPQEQDSVRKAIIEARSRARARSHAQCEPPPAPAFKPFAELPTDTSSPARPSVAASDALGTVAQAAGPGTTAMPLSLNGDDPDAMEID